jgi:hypothetical protein
MGKTAMRALLVLVLVVVVSQTAKAEQQYFKTGTELLGDCLTADTELISCLSYVTGAVDAISLNNESGHCVISLPHVTAGDLRAVVVDYLNKHPKEWDYPASYAVLMAITKAYPCPK